MSRILGTPKKIVILQEVLFSDDAIRVNDIAKRKKVSTGFTSKYLQELKKGGVVRKRKEGYFTVESPLTKALRILMNQSILQGMNFKKHMIQGAGVYGSWAKGENRSDSDIDIWIFSERRMSEEEISEIAAEIRKRTGCEVDMLALNPEKVRELKKNERLYCALRESFVIYGKGLDELEGMYP